MRRNASTIAGSYIVPRRSQIIATARLGDSARRYGRSDVSAS
jgi:hypothetical protein